MSINYRPEIDGLRALAVVSVLLFHAEIPGFSGGFVGVDIFFVISGFLITAIIAREMETGRFSYARFLERRIRRILPALLVVMLVTVPLAWATMLPDPFENYGQSLFATAISANNILLAITAGYWDAASEFKPLMHTWSLGVEEQFYLIFPFFLLALYRQTSHSARIFLLVTVALASFSLMAISPPMEGRAAFYLLHFRAWELIMGVLGALVVMRWQPGPSNGLALSGAIFMLLTILGNGFTRDFAPWSLLLATAGALQFLVFSDRRSWVGRIFSLRPVVFLGLVSYSLYLWHQPVFAFLRITSFKEPGISNFVGGMMVALVLSALSWIWVEQPFRGAAQVKTQRLYLLVIPGLVLLAGCGLAIHFNHGFPLRVPGATGESADPAKAMIAYNERIHTLLPQDFPDQPDGRPKIAIVGNSFARDFANVLLEAGIGEQADLAYRSDLNICSLTQPSGEAGLALLRRADVIVFASGVYPTSCISALSRIIPEAYSENKVLFAGPKEFGWNLNPLVRMAPKERAVAKLEIPPELAEINRTQAHQLGEKYIDILKIISPDGIHVRACDQEGDLLTTDQRHLSRAGAREIARSIENFPPAIARLVSKKI